MQLQIVHIISQQEISYLQKDFKVISLMVVSLSTKLLGLENLHLLSEKLHQMSLHLITMQSLESTYMVSTQPQSLLEIINMSLMYQTPLTLDTTYLSHRITSINQNIHSIILKEQVPQVLMPLGLAHLSLNSLYQVTSLTSHTTLTHLDQVQIHLLVLTHLLMLLQLHSKAHLLYQKL